MPGNHDFTPNLFLTNAAGVREKFIFQATLTDGPPPDITTQLAGDILGQMTEHDNIITGKVTVSDTTLSENDEAQPTLPDQQIAGKWGHLSMVNQVWTYQLDAAEAQRLNNVSVEDTFYLADSNGMEHKISITINGENTAPSDLELLNNQISEGVRTDLGPVGIGILRAFDAEDRQLSYSIDQDYNHQTGQLFDVIDNLLVLKQGAHITPGSYGIKVTATDSQGETTTDILRVITHRDPIAKNEYPSLRLDNIESSLIFDENDINPAPKPIFTQAQFSDPYMADFSTGSFSIDYRTNGPADEYLLVITNNDITITDAGEIYYLNTHIATRSATENGQTGSGLHLDFTAAATLDTLNALLQTIHYQNTSDTPESTREMIFTVRTDMNLQTDYTSMVIVNPERDDSSFDVSHPTSINENAINQTPVDIDVSVSGKIDNLRGGEIHISLSRSDRSAIN